MPLSFDDISMKVTGAAVCAIAGTILQTNVSPHNNNAARERIEIRCITQNYLSRLWFLQSVFEWRNRSLRRSRVRRLESGSWRLLLPFQVKSLLLLIKLANFRLLPLGFHQAVELVVLPGQHNMRSD